MMKRIYPVLLALLFFSCDILRDSPFEVTAWTPGEGYHQDVQNLVVSLYFSGSCDRTKTEMAFSITSDNRPVKGDFYWEENRMFFLPSAPLEENRDYSISLGTEAQSENGLSLERKFQAAFTTRVSDERPRIVSTTPEYDGRISESRVPVTIRFSGPVAINSCADHISFVPAITGSWNLEEGGRLAVFIPLEPWKTDLRYKATVSADFIDVNGRAVGEEYTFFFTTAIMDDIEKPEFISAWALNDNKEPMPIFPEEAPDNITREFGEWETFTKLRIDFSKPVDTESVRNRLAVEPHATMAMETPPGIASSVVFRFTEAPLWQSRFVFSLRPGVRDQAGNETQDTRNFRIYTGGVYSKPPSLVGIRLPLVPGNECNDTQDMVVFMPDNSFKDFDIKGGNGRFPYLIEKDYRLELYFETAPETKVDLFSLMNLFKVETQNNPLTFSFRKMIDEDFTWQEPVTGWESFQRVEIRGFLTNTVNSGPVTFKVGAGLQDTRGNRNHEAIDIKTMK